VNETLVLGGGLAGAGAASLLAAAGRPVRLLEREPGPHHKVCGEFLSVEAQRDLERIGLDIARLGPVPIGGVRLVSGEREAESALPFTALGLSRKLLDEALLDHAATLGAQIERGVRITQVNDGRVATSHGDSLSDTILLATGKHDVRGASHKAPRGGDGYVGFKMHYRAGARTRRELAGMIELVVFKGGYAGMQLVATDVMNLCLIVRRARLADAGDWERLLLALMDEPGMRRRLEDAEALFDKPLAISGLPYGHVCKDADGLYRLGDQAAMTASLTGDGMAIALRSAVAASEAVLSGTPPELFQRHFSKEVTGQISRAMLLQRAAEAPPLLALALPILKLWPRLLGHAAAMTRLPA